MKRLPAFSIALVMVLAACGGSTEETTVEPVPVRTECSDIGHFQQSVAQLATIVSESDTYSFRVHRYLSSLATPYYSVDVVIGDLDTKYTDFLNSQGLLFADSYRVSLVSSAEPLDDTLCEALDDLAEHFGIEVPKGGANHGLTTALEYAFENLPTTSGEPTFHHFGFSYHGVDAQYGYLVFASGGRAGGKVASYASDTGDDVVEVLKNVLRQIEHAMLWEIGS